MELKISHFTKNKSEYDSKKYRYGYPLNLRNFDIERDDIEASYNISEDKNGKYDMHIYFIHKDSRVFALHSMDSKSFINNADYRNEKIKALLKDIDNSIRLWSKYHKTFGRGYEKRPLVEPY